MKTELPSASEAHSVFDQSGQKVNLQVNIAGDYVVGHTPGTLSPIVSTAPSPLATFIGRKDELETICNYLVLDKPNKRIVLYGMGGVGKTAIALEVAKRLKAEFPGGIFWGALHDHAGNPRQILYTWGRACTDDLLAEFDLNSLAAYVRNLLSARLINYGAMLVVCDHLQKDWIAGYQIIANAVPADVPIIVTIQEREIAESIGSEIIGVDSFEQDEALQLFSTHVGRTAVETESEPTRNLLASIGHHPLAVEIAGRRLKFQLQKPGHSIAKFHHALLNNTFKELVLPGTPSLATIFSSTYKLLSTSTQTIFHCLGVFVAGPVTIEGTAAIATVDQTTAEAALDLLVAAGLLEWSQNPGEYTIHPLLRRYTKLLLEHSTNAETRRKSHLHYCLDFIRRNTQFAASSHDRLENMLPDLISAIGFAQSNQLHKEIVAFADLLYTTSSFLEIRSYVHEAEQLLKGAIASCQALKDRNREARHLSNLGNVYLDTGRLEQAFESYHKALLYAHDGGDQQLEIDILISLGREHRALEKLDEAHDYFQKALTIANRINDRRSQDIIFGNLGNIHLSLSHFDKAIEYYDRSREIAREVADHRSEGVTLGNLARLYQMKGKLDIAVKYYAQASSISKQVGDRRSMGAWLGGLGDIHSELKQWEQAHHYYSEALTLARQTVDIRREGILIGNLGIVYEKQANTKQAIQCYRSALEIAQKIDDGTSERVWLNNLGAIHCQLGNPEQALGYLTQALELASSQDDKQAISDQLIRLGLAYKATGQHEKAREQLTKAQSALPTVENLYDNLIRAWLADETFS